VFYQVFDKGMMTDGAGREIDFRNTAIIITSNAGTGLISRPCADPNALPDADKLAEARELFIAQHRAETFIIPASWPTKACAMLA
jgi:type VI secretion system protein VasG